MRQSISAVFAICCASLTGCGTFADGISGPLDGHVFYRGVRMDIAAVKECGHPEFAADIPFSAIADTVMIPPLAILQLTNPTRPGPYEGDPIRHTDVSTADRRTNAEDPPSGSGVGQSERSSTLKKE